MYGIFTYIYHKNQLNVGKYTSPIDPLGNTGPTGSRELSPTLRPRCHNTSEDGVKMVVW